MTCNPCGSPILEGEARVTVRFAGTPSLEGVSLEAHARCIRFDPTPAARMTHAEFALAERNAILAAQFAEAEALGEDCGAPYCVDPGNCARHDEPANEEVPA